MTVTGEDVVRALTGHPRCSFCGEWYEEATPKDRATWHHSAAWVHVCTTGMKDRLNRQGESIGQSKVGGVNREEVNP